MSTSFRTQIFRFVVVGLSATVVDAGLYFGLIHGPLPGRYDIAKAVAFLFGTLVSFLLNKYWTFNAPGRSGAETARFLVLYGATFGLNVGVNGTLVDATVAMGLAVALAEPLGWFCATACSTICNFIGQKFWVFRAPASPDPA